MRGRKKTNPDPTYLTLTPTQANPSKKTNPNPKNLTLNPINLTLTPTLTRPEATDAHIENLTGLNDKASAAASALTHRPTPEAPMVATHW